MTTSTSFSARKGSLMIRPLLALGLMLAMAPIARAEITGDWTAFASKDHPERLRLSMTNGRNQHEDSRYQRSWFSGLRDDQIDSASPAEVHFELRRDAGVIAFEGTFQHGRGIGGFTFTANHDFLPAVRRLGIEMDRDNDQDEEQQLYELALFDVSTDFIRSMQSAGYSVPLRKYIEFRIFEVDPAYVKEMGSLGFDHLSASQLTETRIHGATPDYIRSMRAAGNDLTLDQYIESRIFAVSPEFVQQMSRLGYSNLDHSTLTQFKIHGVSPEFVEELKKLGYDHLPAQQLVEMKIHGVTPEFIRRVAVAGYKNVPVEKLVQMRIFGIDPEMVRALDDAGSKRSAHAKVRREL
jgi:hypothetical protein